VHDQPWAQGGVAAASRFGVIVLTRSG